MVSMYLFLYSARNSILPWQFGMLGLKENGGNRVIKYADELIDGVGYFPSTS